MWEIRTITDDESELFRSRLARGFGGDAETEEEAQERFWAVFERDRMFAVFDGDDIVGTGGAFSLDLTVPGGATVPMGGTTMVTVQPTHRRRGILRQLMATHLEEVAGRDEPIAGLWASESTIYERFGYGPASFRHNMEVEAGLLRSVGPTGGAVRILDVDEATKTLPDVYDEVRKSRPGMFDRTEAWWEARIFGRGSSSGGSSSAPRYLVHENDGEVNGYAVYKQKSVWENFVSDGKLEVDELITRDPTAHRALWGFLTNVDLFPNVTWWNAPVDDLLALLVRDSRRVRRSLSDALWIRLMDVPVALEARQYEHDGVVVLGVRDETRKTSAGSFRIEVAGGQGSCQQTDEEPEVELDISVLGHLYLGGGSAVAMASAGKIDGNPRAVTTLHRLFRTDVAPWCPEIF